MSVATKNPFALLDAEDSSRPSSPAPAAKAPAPAPPAPATARGTQQKPRGGPAARGGKYYQRGGAPKDAGNPNQNGVEEPTGKHFEGRAPRGTRGGRGGARGGRGRPFDRHSQTGKTDSDKKLHQSWGGDNGNSELKVEEEATVDASAEGATNEWAADSSANADAWGAAAATTGDAAPDAATPAAEGDKERRPRREREPEEEDNNLTYEQYLAQKKENEAIPKLENTRQANEGADANIWKDVVQLEKAEEDAYFVGKSKAAPKTRTEKKEKVFLEIDARFERPSRGAPRGGGRGGDRGDRGRGEGRGGGRGRGAPRGRANGGNAATVNVDDEKAFPSLS